MFMNDMIMKKQLMEYAEGIITPALAEDLQFCESFDDEEGETNIWLLETDTGEEYWVLEGVYPSNIYKKSGIYQDAKRVYEAYKEMLEEADAAPQIPDRFQQPLR